MMTSQSVVFGAIEESPFVNSCAFNLNCSRPGYDIEAILYVCESLKWNCTIAQFNSSDYGTYDENTNAATGLIGAVFRGEFDASQSVLTPTYARHQAVAFSEIFFYTDLIVLTRSPLQNDTVEMNWNILLGFQWQVWTAMAVCLYLACACVIFIQNGFDISVRFLISEFLRIALALITRQYGRIEKRPSAIVLLVTIWAVVFVVLSNAYTGILVSQKVVAKIDPPFKDLDTLVDCLAIGKCRLVATTETSGFQLVMSPFTSTGIRAKQVLRNNPVIHYGPDEIYQRILDEKQTYLVWIMSANPFYAMLHKYPEKACSFYTFTAPFNDNGAIAVRKNSTLLRSLNKMASKFRDSGVYRVIESKYLRSVDKAICDMDGANNDIYLQLSEIKLLLAFYGLGIIAGCLVFFIETVCIARHLMLPAK